MWMVLGWMNTDLGKYAYVRGSRETIECLRQAKGRFLNWETNLQQDFQPRDYSVLSNQVAKAWLKVLGMTRRNSAVWLSTNLTLQHASVWAAKHALKLLQRDTCSTQGLDKFRLAESQPWLRGEQRTQLVEQPVGCTHPTSTRFGIQQSSKKIGLMIRTTFKTHYGVKNEGLVDPRCWEHFELF